MWGGTVGVDGVDLVRSFGEEVTVGPFQWLRDDIFLLVLDGQARLINSSGDWVDQGDFPTTAFTGGAKATVARKVYGASRILDLDDFSLTPVSWDGPGGFTSVPVVNESETRIYGARRTGASPVFQYWVDAFDIGTLSHLWTVSGPTGVPRWVWGGQV
jgi:hypothetical protein